MSATRNKFSPEFGDRAVRMVGEHRGDYPSEWAAMTSIAGKVGCTTESRQRMSPDGSGFPNRRFPAPLPQRPASRRKRRSAS